MKNIALKNSTAPRQILTEVRSEASLESRIAAIASAALCIALCGCASAMVSKRQQLGAAPTKKPAVIYVSDFKVNASDIKFQQGMFPTPPKPPTEFADLVPAVPGQAKDAEVVAREIIEDMSTALVKHLTKAGFDARRLALGAQLPKSGWLISGAFTSVNQGNQLNRAVIGFGSGKTDLQVAADISDLLQDTPTKFYELNTVAESGKSPGAGPTAVGAIRYMVAGKDLNHDVKRTALQISTEVIQRAHDTESQTLAMK